MVVAENRLSTDLIVEGLAQHAADIPANMLYYQDARGIIQLRETIAHVLQRTFMKVGISSCHSMQSKWYNAGNAGLDASLAVFFSTTSKQPLEEHMLEGKLPSV